MEGDGEDSGHPFGGARLKAAADMTRAESKADTDAMEYNPEGLLPAIPTTAPVDVTERRGLDEGPGCCCCCCWGGSIQAAALGLLRDTDASGPAFADLWYIDEEVAAVKEGFEEEVVEDGLEGKLEQNISHKCFPLKAKLFSKTEYRKTKFV